jgi:hypothetical protein
MIYLVEPPRFRNAFQSPTAAVPNRHLETYIASFQFQQTHFLTLLLYCSVDCKGASLVLNESPNNGPSLSTKSAPSKFSPSEFSHSILIQPTNNSRLNTSPTTLATPPPHHPPSSSASPAWTTMPTVPIAHSPLHVYATPSPPTSQPPT